jgi:protein CrcB
VGNANDRAWRGCGCQPALRALGLGGAPVGRGLPIWHALLTTRFASSEAWRLVLVTGLLGGFTTFSTFSYETYMLLVSGSWLAAGLNILASVGLGMVGVFLGAVLARLIM